MGRVMSLLLAARIRQPPTTIQLQTATAGLIIATPAPNAMPRGSPAPSMSAQMIRVPRRHIGFVRMLRRCVQTPDQGHFHVAWWTQATLLVLIQIHTGQATTFARVDTKWRLAGTKMQLT